MEVLEFRLVFYRISTASSLNFKIHSKFQAELKLKPPQTCLALFSKLGRLTVRLKQAQSNVRTALVVLADLSGRTAAVQQSGVRKQFGSADKEMYWGFPRALTVARI